jgi:phospho-N-acetylmuramoyl-pentapeptide-transferase
MPCDRPLGRDSRRGDRRENVRERHLFAKITGMFSQLLERALGAIPLRAALAAATSFAIWLALGPTTIAWLRRRCREPNKMPSAELARLHQAKAATPTMGGLLVVGGLIASSLALADWTTPYVPIAVGLAVALAALGACDDWIKLATSRRGMSARTKFGTQCACAALASLLLLHAQSPDTRDIELAVPLVGSVVISAWCFLPWATLVIVASSNAVNLADGLDGLAGGCMVVASAALALVVYASGHAQWSAYLNIPYVAGAGELTILAAAMVGALLGFLRFNCHPASVFMGDAGSLPLGGLMGLLAVVARQELLLVAIGGVFVVEAASVIVQVASYRLRGKRVLLCAPLHHHFQMKGWNEDQIVVRFWIAAGLCAVVGLAALAVPDADLVDFSQVTQANDITSLNTANSKTPDVFPNY